MKDEKEPLATGAQYAQFGLAISLRVVKTLGESGKNFTVKEIQQMISDPDKKSEVEEIADRIAREILNIKVDPWTREKEKISKFWKECFSFDVPWDKLTVPDAPVDMKMFDLAPQKFSVQQIFDAYAKRFGKDKVYNHYSNTGIDKSIKEQQNRPDGDYLYKHCGGDEPDSGHLGESYDDFSSDGNSYMVPKEGIISAFRYRFETGRMYDVKGLTRFHALDVDGYAVCLYRGGNGGFYIDWGDRGYRYPDYGPRQVSF